MTAVACDGCLKTLVIPTSSKYPQMVASGMQRAFHNSELAGPGFQVLTVEDATAFANVPDADAAAIREGWRVDSGMHFCPDCVSQKKVA